MPTRKKTEPATGQDNSVQRRDQSGKSDGVSGPVAVSEQLSSLEHGIKLFREEKFAEAKEWFDRAAAGKDSAIAHTARTRADVCARRAGTPALDFHSADEHYHYGVERLNARDLTTARKHLEMAASLNPGTDYMLYGYAAALALSGDLSGAYENLKRAIEIDPRNRNTARQDSDFSSVAHNPLFSPLLFPERG